jgi:hypothetical protein
VTLVELAIGVIVGWLPYPGVRFQWKTAAVVM